MAEADSILEENKLAAPTVHLWLISKKNVTKIVTITNFW
jgi:hypothetical protein